MRLRQLRSRILLSGLTAVALIAPAQADRDETSDQYAPQSFSAPILKEGRVTSEYGIRKDPFTGSATWHGGVDIAQGWEAPLSTPANGKVIFAEYKSGYGKTVDVELVESGNIMRFAHLHTISVSVGDSVSAGDVVGLMGSAGRGFGPHAHIEYIQDGKQYNPAHVPGLELISAH